MAKKKKKASKEAENLAMLVVESRLKDRIRELGFRASSEVSNALNARIHGIITEATSRCEENGRQTVRPCDV